jgi:hypothetical protein
VLADLLSVNRRLLEEVRERIGRLGAHGEPRSASDREPGDGPAHGGGAARNNDSPAGRLLRGPGHVDTRTRDSADRKVR